MIDYHKPTAGISDGPHRADPAVSLFAVGPLGNDLKTHPSHHHTVTAAFAWTSRALSSVANAWTVLWPILVEAGKTILVGLRWFFVKGLRIVPVAMVLTTIVTAILLKMYPERGRDVVLVLSGFFASDAVYRLFIGGGSGIGMIPATGTQARAHGYVFLAVWVGILVSALVGAWAADSIYDTLVAPGQADFGSDIIVGAIFSVLVWADTHLRYLKRPSG